MRRPIGVGGWLAIVGLIAATGGAWALCLWGPVVGRGVRNVEHVACFSVWSALLAIAIRHVLAWPWGKAVLVTALIALAAAGIGEFLQFRMDGHTPEWRGFWWSCLGISVGITVVAPAWLIARARTRLDVSTDHPNPPTAGS